MVLKKLRFDGELENVFLEDYFRKSVRQLRMVIVLGAAIYALFGALDGLISPEVKHEIWIIRYAVVCPVFLLTYMFTFTSHFRKYMQAAIALPVLIAGLGIVVMAAIARAAENPYYYVGIILIIMSAYAFSKLRLVYASGVSWALVVAYDAAALLLGGTPLQVFLTFNYFFISGNLIGMFSNYHMERYIRRDFIQNMTVENATKSLRESEEKFRTMANTTAAAIFMHQGGKFIYANPAGETISGYTVDEILNMDFWSLTHPDYREMIIQRGRSRLKGDQPPPRYEFKIVRKNGEERWVYMTAGIVQYMGKPTVIGTLIDINDLKKAEDEKAELYAESVKNYQERIEEEKRHLIEKEKIIMDLHDGIGGITTNISLLAELAQKASSLEEIKKTLSTITNLSRDGMSEVRSFMHSLDSRDITWNTMTAELRKLGTTMLEPHSIAFEMKSAISDGEGHPGSLLCLTLFKIYKESLTNVLKHSRAGAVEVALNVGQDRLELTIRDNGIGLQEAKAGGRGLSNIRARAGEIGGAVSFASDGGASVRFEVPLPIICPAQGMEF